MKLYCFFLYFLMLMPFSMTEGKDYQYSKYEISLWDNRNYCYCNVKFSTMPFHINGFDDFLETKYFEKLPPHREKYEDKYHEKYKALCSNVKLDSYRYPEVQKYIFLRDQILDLRWELDKDWAERFFKRTRENDEKTKYLTNRYATYQLCKQKLQEFNFTTLKIYIELFENCLKQHSNAITFRDYGLLSYMNNNFDKSLELLKKFIETSEKEDLNAQIYHELGSVCFEAMQYEKSIEYLSEAIKKDPDNKELYFDRALSYFETGNFDLALQDYKTSDNAKTIKDATNDSKNLFERYKEVESSDEFKVALFTSMAREASETAFEFIPSLLNSMYGLGEVLWTGIENFSSLDKTLESLHCFSAACHEIGDELINFYQNLDLATARNHAKQLYSQYNELTETEKGELIGSAIGKFGVEVFTPGATIKGIALLKNLKNINRCCYLEQMALSSKKQQEINRRVLQRFAEREKFLQKVTLNVDKQNKHIVGKHNYEYGKSIFEHPDPDRLLKKFKGTGTPIGKQVEHKYDEIVDFKEHIGTWTNRSGSEFLPTTRGRIHYSKTKAHIVPAHPIGKD